jgi:hypothetical protein
LICLEKWARCVSDRRCRVGYRSTGGRGSEAEHAQPGATQAEQESGEDAGIKQPGFGRRVSFHKMMLNGLISPVISDDSFSADEWNNITIL